MSERNDILKSRYANNTPEEQRSSSWIPKRPNASDPMEMARRQINRSLEEREEIINNDAFLKDIKDDIFQQVEAYLLEAHGQEMFKRKMDHFNESWEKFFGRYGNIVILALGELTDEIDFLNYEGYIDKYKLSKQIESVSKRLGL